MRKFIIYTLLIFSWSCKAQQVGLFTGVNMANVKTDGNLTTGLNLGFVIDSDINKRIGMSGGLHLTHFYSEKFTSFTTSNLYENRRRNGTLNVPLLFKFNLANPVNVTTSDFWICTGLISGFNMRRVLVREDVSTGEKSRSSLEIDERFLLGWRTSIEISNFSKKTVAYTLGANFDLYNDNIFNMDYFYSIGLFFKISLITNDSN